jgi:hypothetical protein
MSKEKYQIDVDLDVFKALTARIDLDGQTHNDVLRELLVLDSPVEHDEAHSPFLAAADALGRAAAAGAFYSRGLSLPNGTRLRSRYKGRFFEAEIRDGQWIADDGSIHDSPSAAATAITETNVNGLRFWEGMRPGDRGWRRLDVIRDISRK